MAADNRTRLFSNVYSVGRARGGKPEGYDRRLQKLKEEVFDGGKPWRLQDMLEDIKRVEGKKGRERSTRTPMARQLKGMAYKQRLAVDKFLSTGKGFDKVEAHTKMYENRLKKALEAATELNARNRRAQRNAGR